MFALSSLVQLETMYGAIEPSLLAWCWTHSIWLFAFLQRWPFPVQAGAKSQLLVLWSVSLYLPSPSSRFIIPRCGLHQLSTLSHLATSITSPLAGKHHGVWPVLFIFLKAALRLSLRSGLSTTCAHPSPRLTAHQTVVPPQATRDRCKRHTTLQSANRRPTSRQRQCSRVAGRDETLRRRRKRPLMRIARGYYLAVLLAT